MSSAGKNPSASQLLKAVPHANAGMTCESCPDGGLLLTIPMRRPRWMVPPLTWLLPLRDVRRVELDALGREVLEFCDGHKSVEKIVADFAACHNLSFREAQISVMQFLKMLTQRGVVAIVAG